jgi:hypothetical protein
MRARRIVVVLLAAVVVLLVAGCKRKPPKAGTPCTKEGDFVCADDKTRMACTGGTWVMEHCLSCTQTTSRGLGGSSSMSSYIGCVAGGIGPEGAACTGDTWDCDDNGKTLVRCMDGKYRRFACRGKEACHRSDTKISCDHSLADANDACTSEGLAACSSDMSTMLKCNAGKFTPVMHCGGPKRCQLLPDSKMECDNSTANVGDLCIAGATCSMDGKSILDCKNNKETLFRTCRGADPKCVRGGDLVNCNEPSTGEVGDGCQPGAACSSDKKQFLECKDGKFVATHKCKSCTVKGDRVNCNF